MDGDFDAGFAPPLGNCFGGGEPRKNAPRLRSINAAV
jgi:hypothetical protein